MPNSPFSPRERFALASMLFVSVHILRELWAYYDNWRSASRVFDEEFVVMHESTSFARSTPQE